MGAARVVARSVDVGGTTTASAAELSDGELVSAHLDGDGQAFEALYERYHPRLLAFCRYRTKTQQNAEDVAHDVIVRALTYLEGFDCDRPVWPWLKRIATNELADHYRRSSREVDMPDYALHGADPDANEHTVWLAERAALLQAMDSLSPRDRSVLELKYCNDWDSQELQEMLNVERSALYKILQRARNRLHSAYEELADSKLGIALLVPLVERVRRQLSRIRGTTANQVAPASLVAGETLAYSLSAIAMAVGLGAAGLANASSGTPPHVSNIGAADIVTSEIARTPEPSADIDDKETGPAETTVGTPLRTSTGSQDDGTTKSHISGGISVDQPTPERVSAGANVEETDTDEDRTLNRRIEARVGDEGPWSDGETTIYCTGSTVNEAMCDAYDEVDNETPNSAKTSKEQSRPVNATG